MRFLTNLPILAVTLMLTACGSRQSLADLPRATEAAPEGYAELLFKYATPSGVRYAAWHKNAEDLAKLKDVVDFYASTLPPKDRDTSLAWHVNAYNAWILHNILKKFPTKGPLDGETLFFHGNRIVISGRKTSFDNLEKKPTIAVFRDPRIHFVVNCASESCPPLHTEPFNSTTLDADFDKLTHRFINENPQGVVLSDNKVKLSKIFEWYADDFGGKDQLISYINRYRNAPIPADSKIEFLDYSWKLNAVK